MQDSDILIQERFEDLLNSCKKSTTEENKKLIRKAFNFANKAHEGIKRKSGEPYILHPIAVAKIVTTEIGLGTKSVIASLLHDVVEDTDYTVEDLSKMFGPKIASIVDGLTKISGVSSESISLQAENFRKIVLTLSEDLRVILIKLADRLHNMRTLNSMPERKQVKIAGETLYIYAPIANRMGLYAIKSELEDLSFRYEHPSEYDFIEEQIKQYQIDNADIYSSFISEIKERLEISKYVSEITLVKKSVYSVWNKVRSKNLKIEDINDLISVRVKFSIDDVNSEKLHCWNVYSLITDIFIPKPERIRDWLSIPKANGYEGLHVTVMGPQGKWIEVQIRSKRMNDIDEKGFAAYWKYKTDGVLQENELEKWLAKTRDMLADVDNDAMEFIDSFKLNLYNKEIFVFTPKGEKIILPKGASVLDFAYDIHTEIGNKCIGAKVNKKLVAISHKIKSGDQVEIITSDSQIPQHDWLNFVITAKAKNTIKTLFKEQRKQMIINGMQMFADVVQESKLSSSSLALKVALEYFNYENKDDLYRNIGRGKINIDELQLLLDNEYKRTKVNYFDLRFLNKKNNKEKSLQTSKKLDKNQKEFDLEDYNDYEISKCCNPIPGDDIVAIQNDRGKIIIHSRMCTNALKLMASHGDKIIAAKWVSTNQQTFIAAIQISGIDRVGIVKDITIAVSDNLVANMKSINIDTGDGIFEGEILFYVHNMLELDHLIEDLSKISGVEQVQRIKNH